MSEFEQAPLQIGKVVLTVHDLDRVKDFYRAAIGLSELSGDGESAVLGAGNAAFLELRRDPHARTRSPREAGLFHTAFLLPSRADLGGWLRHAAEWRLALQGASNHVVSEALYLADPEGNGIEVYADRPARSWPREDGRIVMRTDPLDADDLLSNAGSRPWAEAPEGTTIGHVHLQVGSTTEAEAFYAGLLGLDLTVRYPGASFFSSGGYHHHLATNVWNSRNALPRDEPTTGLASLELRVLDPAIPPAVEARARTSGVAASRCANRLALRDPWNTPITLSETVPLPS